MIACRLLTDPKKSAWLKRFYCCLNFFFFNSEIFVPCFSKVPVSGIFGILSLSIVCDDNTCNIAQKYKVHVFKSKTETCTDVYLASCMLSTCIFILYAKYFKQTKNVCLVQKNKIIYLPTYPHKKIWVGEWQTNNFLT